MSNNPKIMTIRAGILEENDRRAQILRRNFAKNKTIVINVVSSPGSGKTELLTVVSRELITKGLHVCAIVGDLSTDHDAKRLASSGAHTYQINTHGACHLDARMVKQGLKTLPWRDADILFIENVGNLVCPASYDLGETKRMVLMAVTEGEDKPLKYPTMFHSADICVISKIDLASVAEFDEQKAIQNINDVNPDISIIKTSAKKRIGIEELATNLLAK